MRGWAGRLEAEGALRETEALMLQAAFGEYLAQLASGIALSQVEIVRPQDLGLDEMALAAFRRPEVARLIGAGNTDTVRMRLAALLRPALETGDFGRLALRDEQLEMIRDQFRRFAEKEVVPHAHGWHLRDELVPLPIVEQMAALGVFGLTVPVEYGGLGLGKTAMVIVSE